MKKFISVILSVIMLFGIVSIAVSAEDIEADMPKSYTIILTEQEFAFGLEYDLYNFRTDYIGKYMGYEYGVDYWFTLNNWDGTTTDIKGLPYSVDVFAGDAFEVTISVADYVEPTTVRMLAVPTELTEKDPKSLYDEVTGEPDSAYHISGTVAGTFGLRPTEDMTVCVSEWHLYNKGFLYKFPSSSFYKTQRVFKDDTATEFEKMYTPAEWGNTKLIYENETLFFEVRLPLDGNGVKYHYNDYQVSYTTENAGRKTTTYVKTANQTEMGMCENCTCETCACDKYTKCEDCTCDPCTCANWVAHYIIEADPEEGIIAEQVDVFAIPNVDPTVNIKVTGTITYTIGMLEDFFRDFSFEDLEDFDWDSVEFGPMAEYICRILVLILKILAGFGLNINLFG